MESTNEMRVFIGGASHGVYAMFDARDERAVTMRGEQYFPFYGFSNEYASASACPNNKKIRAMRAESLSDVPADVFLDALAAANSRLRNMILTHKARKVVLN